ncbi:MAG: hypothetical protein SWQ30_16270 [Thermodesulfobacteriota bacterium]|nr:hypothetical protein [Thermodesulfobacteriota bacterium]
MKLAIHYVGEVRQSQAILIGLAVSDISINVRILRYFERRAWARA